MILKTLSNYDSICNDIVFEYSVKNHISLRIGYF